MLVYVCSHYITVRLFQQTLRSIAGSLITPLLVADAACGNNDNNLLTTLLGTTMLMNGICSFMQVVVGIRLVVITSIEQLEPPGARNCPLSLSAPRVYENAYPITISLCKTQLLFSKL